MTEQLIKPEIDRLIALYRQGHSHRMMAEDPELVAGLLSDRNGLDSRRRKISHLIELLIAHGKLSSRGEGWMPLETETKNGEDTVQVSNTPFSLQQERVKQYEVWIGAKAKETAARYCHPIGKKEIVVISDPHIPDEREDLIAVICARHKGAHCVVAGDVNNFANFSRFTKDEVGLPDIQGVVCRTDAFFEVLMGSFASVEVLLGNHDLRLPRMMGKLLNSSDLYWITQQWLCSMYERRHGVRMVKNVIQQPNGRNVETFHWHQIGDAVISHVETSGRVQGRGVERAHDFFFGFKDAISLSPFKLILHAHSHKRTWFQHPVTGIHCIETGAVCANPAYAFRNSGQFSPVQNGYYLLTQQDGKTLLNESRLFVL